MNVELFHNVSDTLWAPTYITIIFKLLKHLDFTTKWMRFYHKMNVDQLDLPQNECWFTTKWMLEKVIHKHMTMLIMLMDF